MSAEWDGGITYGSVYKSEVSTVNVYGIDISLDKMKTCPKVADFRTLLQKELAQYDLSLSVDNLTSSYTYGGQRPTASYSMSTSYGVALAYGVRTASGYPLNFAFTLPCIPEAVSFDARNTGSGAYAYLYCVATGYPSGKQYILASAVLQGSSKHCSWEKTSNTAFTAGETSCTLGISSSAKYYAANTYYSYNTMYLSNFLVEFSYG